MRRRCLCIAILITLPLAAQSARFNAAMDNGTTIAVDNDSSRDNTWVGGLVVAADRSAQDDCPYAHSRKGLMRTGDRVYVNDNYMAWFDYTQSDGITFANPPYGGSAGRSGALTGWWTLDPATGYFRYWKTGPNGCWNWAHNELIPGSASPNQEQHWWDKYYTPNEHVFCPIVGSNKYFFPYCDAWRTSRTNFTTVLDGLKDAAGTHYKTSCKMCSWNGNIDCTDDNDSNGIANYVNASLEYVCRANDIGVTWNFMPQSADVVVYNTFIFLWSCYAQDEDGSACDVSSLGSQWPGAVYGQDIYNRSNLATMTGWDGVQHPAGSVFPMVLGPVCSDPYRNQDISTTPRYAVTDGSWIRCGEAADLSTSSPGWLFTNIGAPGSGDGTQGSPYHFAWDRLISWNETHDGTLGFGALTGVYSNPADYKTLLAGKWYRAEYAVTTMVNPDITAPGPVMAFTAARGDQQVSLSWHNPSAVDFTGTMIRYKTTGYPSSATDGTLVVDKPNSPNTNDTCVHTGLTNGRTYYYSAFAHDAAPNYAARTIVYAIPTDSTPTGPVSGFQVVVGNQLDNLMWTNPTDADFAGVKVLYKTTGYPSSATNGTVVYQGTGTSCTHTGLANGQIYYYSAYAFDEVPNYSTAAQTSGTPIYFSPAQAKMPADGAELTLTVGVVSAVFADCFYVQCIDALCGACAIRVVGSAYGIQIGQPATVHGTVLTDPSTGERYVSATWVSGSD